MERSLFSRDLLSLVGKGEDAPAPPPEQRRDEMEEDEVNLALALSLGSGIDDKKGDKIPRSSSAAALPRTSSNSLPPVQAEDRAPRLSASESPSSASLEADAHRLQGTLMSTISLPAVTDAAGNGEYKKRREEQSLTKRLEAKKKMMIERKNSTCSTSKEAAGQVVPQDMNAHTAGKLVSCDEAVVGNNENQSSGIAPKRPRGRPPKYQAALTSQHSLSAAGKKPNPPFKGTVVSMESSSSSSLPSSQAIRRLTSASPLPPSSSLAHIRTAAAATLGSSSRGDQTILGRAAATRANIMVENVGRRLMQEMPAVHTKDLPNGNRVNGFLYKYRKADDVKIVCICHGSFFTPSEFLEHAGAGNGGIVNPLRHIVVSPS